jgi:hypothetical protein
MKRFHVHVSVGNLAFHTLASIPVYGEDTQVFNHGTSLVPVQSPAATGKACCTPAVKT